VVKLIGDGSLSTFDGTARAICCAERICGAASQLDVEIRAGLGTGECEVIDDDIAGMAVHIAERVSANAASGEVLVSRTVRELVTGSGIALQPRFLSASAVPWLAGKRSSIASSEVVTSNGVSKVTNMPKKVSSLRSGARILIGPRIALPS
jgi:class 3 adenylate cyclase